MSLAPTLSETAQVVRSRYLDIVPLQSGAFVAVHSLEQTRMVITTEVVALLESLREPQPWKSWLMRYAAESRTAEETVENCVGELIAAHFIFCGTPDEEEAKYSALASALVRGEASARDYWERRWRARSLDRFAVVRVPRSVESFKPLRHAAGALLLGFCDVHFGADLLRDEARRVGLDLTVDAVFEMDTARAGEKRYDFVIVGALAARHGHWFRADGAGDLAPDRYLASAARVVAELRSSTDAPILLHNLPVPRFTFGGLADGDSLPQRARAINDALANLASATRECYIVDVDACLSYLGKERLLDERLVPSSHLGGLGWWAVLPESELRTIHHQALPAQVGESFDLIDPFAYDRAIVAEQLHWIRVILGFDRKKCVVVDLDNTLWPGVLAETGSPFPPDLDFSLFSYHSIYLGLHEALKALKSRGILLACVSKNDEAVVRELWRYPKTAPLDRLLTLDDFVSHRIDWNEKTDNIAAIARELNIGLESVVFIDDHPVERDKVRTFLPHVLVLGDEPLRLREQLLTMPELQVLRVTEEARARTESTRALIKREKARAQAGSIDEYLRSLSLRCRIERVRGERDLDRLHELIARTNQFSTTGLRLTRQELARIVQEGRYDGSTQARGPSALEARLYSLRAEDRFTDYGLVAACFTLGNEIALFVMSCRVIGLGLEHALLRTVLRELAATESIVSARLVPTDRNLPARSLYPQNGFEQTGGGEWLLDLRAVPIPPCPPHVEIEAAATAGADDA